jgi:flagellar biosynthesis protein FlhF
VRDEDGDDPFTADIETGAMAEIKNEMKTLRGLVEHQLTDLAWGEMGRRQPRRTLLTRRLRALGLSAALTERIARGVSEEKDFERLWREALAVLAREIQVTHDDIVSQGGVVALVGPTGVGKTTTVAKLAARYILRHGPKSVALVTTDDQRIGAVEQLRVYGKILDAPVRLARDAESLREALLEFRHTPLVLIDTAGLSQRDPRLGAQREVIRNAAREVRSYVVLSATAQFEALTETVRVYQPLGLCGAIVTKLDEATSLGGVLSVAIGHGLPLAYMAEGQRVPEDLRPARGHTLVARAVAIQNQTEQMLAREARVTGRAVVNA